MSGLPPGWAWSTVGEIADIQLGRQRAPQHHHGPHMRPYLRAANMTWDGVDLSDVKEMNFDPDEAKVYELRPGDILLNEASGSPNEVGKPVIWNGEIPACCFQNTLLRVRSPELNTRYLYWYAYFSALTGRFGEAGRGVNIRHLGKRGLAAFPIAVAPLAEQERIVAAIEEYCSRLDNAERGLSSGESRLRTFEEAMYQQVLKVDGPRLKLGQVSETTSGGTPRRSRLDYFGGGTAWIKSGELGDGTVLHTQETLSSQGLVASSAKLLPRGSLLIAMYGATIGKLGWVGFDQACTNQAVAAIIPSDSLNSAFLWNVLRAKRRELVAAGQGGAQPNISQTILREVQIPVPSLSEQVSVCEELDRRLTLFRRLTTSVQTAKLRSRQMRRSILAAAFAGRLVDHDPNDEPASVLLDRIRDDRSAKSRRQVSS